MLRVLRQHGGRVNVADFPQRRLRQKALFELMGKRFVAPVYDQGNIIGWTLTDAGVERVKTLRTARPHYKDVAGKGQLERAALEAAKRRD